MPYTFGILFLDKNEFEMHFEINYPNKYLFSGSVIIHSPCCIMPLHFSTNTMNTKYSNLI